MSDTPFGDIFGDIESSAEEQEKFAFSGVFGNKPDLLVGPGAYKRIVPFAASLADDVSLLTLKRNLDELGVTDVMPLVYQNRLKRNVERGYVTPDGKSFTEKGQDIASQYLQRRRGVSATEANARASVATSVPHDPVRAAEAKARKPLNLKFAHGYTLDEHGRTVRND
ncbi:MAG: hypothetical protein AAF621_03710 [Pseudomonadota bacterium]